MSTVNLSTVFKKLDGNESVEELREKILWQRRVLNAILDYLPSSIYVKDHEARKIVANKANYTQAGFNKADDVLGKTDFDMFPRHLAEKFYEDDCTVLKKGNPLPTRRTSYWY